MVDPYRQDFSAAVARVGKAGKKLSKMVEKIFAFCVLYGYSF